MIIKGYKAQICEVHLQYEKVQQNGRFTLFSSKFHSNIYSILFDFLLFICIKIASFFPQFSGSHTYIINKLFRIHRYEDTVIVIFI